MKIVDFNKYNKNIWSKQMDPRVKKIEKKLIEKNRQRKSSEDSVPMREIEDTALEVLQCLEYDSRGISIPIVKIVKAFDFYTYKENLRKEFPGDISIHGSTEESYHHDKIILVKNGDELYHQRFIVAHELSHYLFEFLGNETYSDKSIEFHDNYHKDDHVSIPEKRANRFAASILMPRDSFLEQYNIVKAVYPKPIYIITYLSHFFETPIDSIGKRIEEVMM